MVPVINLKTNRCSRLLGRTENVRFLQIALFQGNTKPSQASITVEMQASENPGLHTDHMDPTLFCTGYKKNRFYLFSRREALDSKELVFISLTKTRLLSLLSSNCSHFVCCVYCHTILLANK